MSRAREQNRRSACQVVLASLVLVGVLAGSLAHIRSAHVEGSADGGHCTACLLHSAVSDASPAVVLPSVPLAPHQPEATPIASPVVASLCTLSLAPKTSPPAGA